MRVLVVGSGGREHALCWALAAESADDEAVVRARQSRAPRRVAENVAIAATDIAALVALRPGSTRSTSSCRGRRRRWSPGIADAMEAAGIACCGPSAAAARLEGSKSFAKEVADAAGIRTALWERFDDAESAREFVRRRGAPIVVKADGLAAGKGVVVAATRGRGAGGDRRDHGGSARFGEAGAAVVIEECLTGEEVSACSRCATARTRCCSASAQDHKRVGRRRHRPEHRRHGRLLAAPGLTPALQQASWTRSSARRSPRWRGGARRSAACCSPG